MLKELGLVIEAKDDMVMVQTVAKTSCNSCQVNASCGIGIISKAFGERSFITPMNNSIKAQEGDQVEVGIPENLVVKASFLVYLLPLTLMILVSLLVTYFFPDMPEIYLMGIALATLIFGFYRVKKTGEKISKNKYLEPVLLRIVKRPITVKQVETS